jgi:hypothetical protein
VSPAPLASGSPLILGRHLPDSGIAAFLHLGQFAPEEQQLGRCLADQGPGVWTPAHDEGCERAVLVGLATGAVIRSDDVTVHPLEAERQFPRRRGDRAVRVARATGERDHSDPSGFQPDRT